MFADLLALFAQVGAATPVPVLGPASVATLSAGACSGASVASSASLRVSWTVANDSDALYETRVYQNNIRVATLLTSVTHYDKTISGAVVNGTYSPWTSDWTYRVDVVRKVDGQVVSSQTAAAWRQFYGACAPSSGGAL